MIFIFSLLLAITIIANWLRVVRPLGVRIEGEVFLTVRLPLLARLRMHAAPIILGTALAIILVYLHGAPAWAIGLPLISSTVTIALPVKYTLTNFGIRTGWTPFRRWTEFAGVSRARGGARLQGVHGSRSMRIWLSRSRGDDEFLQLLRQSIRDGYKGEHRTTVITFPYTAYRCHDLVTKRSSNRDQHLIGPESQEITSSISQAPSWITSTNVSVQEPVPRCTVSVSCTLPSASMCMSVTGSNEKGGSTGIVGPSSCCSKAGRYAR